MSKMTKTMMMTLAGGLVAATTAFAPAANAGYFHKHHHVHKFHHYKPYVYGYRAYAPVCGKYAWVWKHGYKHLVCVYKTW